MEEEEFSSSEMAPMDDGNLHAEWKRAMGGIDPSIIRTPAWAQGGVGKQQQPRGARGLRLSGGGGSATLRLRGGRVHEAWMDKWGVDKKMLEEMDAVDEDESSAASTSSFETELDDPRVHHVQYAPYMPWEETPFSRIPYRTVWPGNGDYLREGQFVRVRWNIAKSFRALALIDPGGLPGSMPWKGEARGRGGSRKWPDDDVFEFQFGRDPLVLPGVEEVLANVRVGGRVHCVVAPALGFGVEQGVRYEKPLPPDADERDLLLAWMGPDFFDEEAWRQLRPLAWELDVVSADGVGE